jgi:hypothetical protein
MSEVKSVAVSVSSPSPTDPAGCATIGFYLLEGDVLTMTDGDGKPVRRRYSGEVSNENRGRAVPLALSMTKRVWRQTIYKPL